MSAPTITPGPWATSRSAVPDWHVQIEVYAEDTGTRIATVFETDANARAIAAVPDLIAALCAVDEADHMHADVYEAAMGSAHALVRAALRKAGVR